MAAAIIAGIICGGCVTATFTFDGDNGASITLGADWAELADGISNKFNSED